MGFRPPPSVAGTGSITRTDAGGNLGAAYTWATGGATWAVLRNVIVNADGTITLGGLAAGQAQRLFIIGTKDATGTSRTLSINDGTGAAAAVTLTTSGQPFELAYDWDGSVGRVYNPGGQGIQGPAGATGPAGSTWFSGSGAPAGGTGADGDYYLRTSNGEVYKKVAGAWVDQSFTLVGPQGTAGTNGILANFKDEGSAVTARDTLDVVGPNLALTQDGTKLILTGVGGEPRALTGATAATRYVGGTNTGAPSSGTFAVGDFVIARDGAIFICTTAGTPGTWTQVSGGGGGLSQATADGRYQPQIPRLVMPAIFHRPFIENVIAPVANRMMAMRCVMPRDGFLRDVSVFIGASSGNLILSVYDTGDASAGNRTRLATSGSLAVGSGSSWQTWDPGAAAVAVTFGQQLDVVLSFDNATVTYGRGPTTGASQNAFQLPAGFDVVAGGASPKLIWQRDPGSFIHDATVSEANCVLGGVYPVLIARVA